MMEIVFAVAFKMYDLDGDMKISKEELLKILHMMVGSNISEEQVSFSFVFFFCFLFFIVVVYVNV
jgi:Ca2+-binding EF-hand superfamily protein